MSASPSPIPAEDSDVSAMLFDARIMMEYETPLLLKVAPLVIAAIFVVISVLIFLIWRPRRPQQGIGTYHGISDVQMQVIGVGGGVDPLIHDKIPKIIYHHPDDESSSSSLIPFEETMCVWCRFEFVDGEQLSMLPSCNHVFHSKCIGEYMSSSTTCPCCRKPISLATDVQDWPRYPMPTSKLYFIYVSINFITYGLLYIVYRLRASLA